MRVFSGAIATLLLAGCAHHRTPVEEKAEQMLEQARIPDSDLTVSCHPDDAEVAVDGIPRGLCSDFARQGAGLKLGQGMHQVSVRKDGYEPYVSYYAPSGARLTLNIELRPERGQGANP